MTTRKDLCKLNKKQLMHLCHKHQLPTNGSKMHIIDRLLGYDANDLHNTETCTRKENSTENEANKHKSRKKGAVDLQCHHGEHRTLLTVTAYFNTCYWSIHQNSQYLPTDLTQLTAEFVGNPFVERADRYICRRPPDYSFMGGGDNGTTVLCSKPCTTIERGRYVFKFKLLRGSWQDTMIGISTNPYYWKGNHYVFTAKRVSVSATHYYACSRGIVTNEVFNLKGDEYQFKMHSKRIAMKIGDVLSVCVDCGASKLVFKMNEKPMKTLHNIVPAKYYLVAQFADKDKSDKSTAFYLMSNHVDVDES